VIKGGSTGWANFVCDAISGKESFSPEVVFPDVRNAIVPSMNLDRPDVVPGADPQRAVSAHRLQRLAGRFPSKTILGYRLQIRDQCS